jgi:hypothetical protein
MCKLSAIVPKNSSPVNKKVTMQLLTGMMLENGRTSNRDGYGIGILETLKCYKQMTAVGTGLISAEAIKWIWDTYASGQVVIGHTRLSTTGKGNTEDRNAHPFTVGQWMLAHNGHIANYDDLKQTLKLPDDVVVDSEIALHSLAKTWKTAPTLTINHFTKGLAELEGSYAFIIGNQVEPDRLYLVVGSNPLNVYYNDRFWLVNTDSQLLSYLNQISWVYGISSGFWQAFTLTELSHNHVYILDRTAGICDLGTFSPKPVTISRAVVYQGQPVVQSVKTTTTSSQPLGQNTEQTSTGSPSNLCLRDVKDDLTDGNVVFPKNTVSQANAIDAFMNKNHLLPSDLREMLQELPTVVPDSPWALTQYDLEILQGWFEQLSKPPNPRFDLQLMAVRRTTWDRFVALLPEKSNPYLVAQQLIPTFITPYYLNPDITLHELVQKATI